MNVSSSNSLSTQAMGATTPTEPQNALGKDAFLRILVTQMKNQNPLEPLKDTEFIGQMTQFSSLEQLTNLFESISTALQFSNYLSRDSALSICRND